MGSLTALGLSGQICVLFIYPEKKKTLKNPHSSCSSSKRRRVCNPSSRLHHSTIFKSVLLVYYKLFLPSNFHSGSWLRPLETTGTRKQWRYLAKQWTESTQLPERLWEILRALGMDTHLLPEPSHQHLDLSQRSSLEIFQKNRDLASPTHQFSPCVQITGSQGTSIFALLMLATQAHVSALQQICTWTSKFPTNARKILAHTVAIPQSSSLKLQT